MTEEHTNFFKKYLAQIIFAMSVPATAAIWESVIRPYLVFQDDLSVVSQKISISVDNNTQHIVALSATMSSVLEEQKKMRIYYLEDRIRELEIKKIKYKLREDEEYRLKSYQESLHQLY